MGFTSLHQVGRGRVASPNNPHHEYLSKKLLPIQPSCFWTSKSFRCAECHGVLIYACGDLTETLTCVGDREHTGLIENADIRSIELSYKDKNYIAEHEAIQFAIDDALLASAIRLKNQRLKITLYGDED